MLLCPRLGSARHSPARLGTARQGCQHRPRPGPCGRRRASGSCQGPARRCAPPAPGAGLRHPRVGTRRALGAVRSSRVPHWVPHARGWLSKPWSAFPEPNPADSTALRVAQQIQVLRTKQSVVFFPTWSNHPSLPADCLLSALQSSPLSHFQAQEHSHPAKPLCPAPTGPDLAAPGSTTRGLERQAGCQSLRRACGWFMEGGIGSARLLLSAAAAQLLAWCILLVGRVPGGSQKIPQIDALGVQPPEGEGKAHPGHVWGLQGVL